MLLAISQFIICTILVATAAHSANVFGKDLANLPPAIVNGWRSLAKASETYTIVFSEVDTTGKHRFSPGVLSRLDNRYVKCEILQPNSSKEDWPQKIKEVILFDGDEYFTIERSKPDAPFALLMVGNNRAVYRILGVGEAPSTLSNGIDFLQSIDSTTETFTNFVQGSQDDDVYVTLKSDDPRMGPCEIVAKLDPEHNYRVASAFATFGSPSNRHRIEYHYDQHPALASEVHLYYEKRVPGTDDWISSVSENPYVTRQQLLDTNLTAGQFTLQHYGLPPFRKRQQSLWSLATIGAAVVVVAGGVFYWWRRRNAES